MIPDYELIGRIVTTTLPWLIGYVVGAGAYAVSNDGEFDNITFLIYSLGVGIVTFWVT